MEICIFRIWGILHNGSYKLFFLIILGYKQRSALVAHVDSSYTMHKELNDARTKWEEMSEVRNVQQWMFGLMRKYRDLWGYFENYDEIREEIEAVKSAAIKKEDYKIAGILTHWLDKLP